MTTQWRAEPSGIKNRAATASAASRVQSERQRLFGRGQEGSAPVLGTARAHAERSLLRRPSRLLAAEQRRLRRGRSQNSSQHPSNGQTWGRSGRRGSSVEGAGVSEIGAVRRSVSGGRRSAWAAARAAAWPASTAAVAHMTRLSLPGRRRNGQVVAIARRSALVELPGRRAGEIAAGRGPAQACSPKRRCIASGNEDAAGFMRCPFRRAIQAGARGRKAGHDGPHTGHCGSGPMRTVRVSVGQRIEISRRR